MRVTSGGWILRKLCMIDGGKPIVALLWEVDTTSIDERYIEIKLFPNQCFEMLSRRFYHYCKCLFMQMNPYAYLDYPCISNTCICGDLLSTQMYSPLPQQQSTALDEEDFEYVLSEEEE